jgi:predicted short-subunit dehydrogenase-like oxidoreductase (DUF2520 family)
MIAIVGGGRMGRGLALALAEAGERVELASGRDLGADEATAACEAASTIMLAVPDDAIPLVAARLAAVNAVSAEQVVLHLSGLHDRRALAPLDGTGAALGSLHPLQTVSSAQPAAERWRGAFAAVEGDDRALAEGERLCRLLGLEPLRLPPGAKPAYHAGAVIASNYVVTLADLAARVAGAAGVEPALASRIYLPLLRGAIESLEGLPAASALTGPIVRGDVATVRAHLQALSDDDRRRYAVLGEATLVLALEAGLDRERAGELRRLLGEAAR